MPLIQTLPASEASALAGLLFDLDDTLLDHGRLGEAAYRALFRLRESGLVLLAVTGRPGGWGELLARQWPIAGVVAENGAVAVRSEGGQLELLDEVPVEERQRRSARLSEVEARLCRDFPELRPTTELTRRFTDRTLDIGERRQVAPSVVAAARRLARSLGARTIASSVHLHLTLDGADKASGSVRFLHRFCGVDPSAARRRFAFIGDSENDAPCFAAFATCIGVANLVGKPSLAPRFRTRAAMGAGFAEAAEVLVTLRARAGRQTSPLRPAETALAVPSEPETL